MAVTVVFPRYVFAWSSGNAFSAQLAKTFYLPVFTLGA